jgi:flavin reductase (DIM6/NTAB) family NADH-FMN oxidoreductase RutF
MKKVDVNEIGINPTKGFLNDWAVVFAGNKESKNAMTVSLGGIGIMWNKSVVYIVIRKSRFTHDFIERENYFSVNFLSSDYKKELTYLGTKSGRNEDKIAKSKLNVDYIKVGGKDVPIFSDSQKTLVCKVIFKQAYTKESFLDSSINKWYKDSDYHDLYIAEIVEALAN